VELFEDFAVRLDEGFVEGGCEALFVVRDMFTDTISLWAKFRRGAGTGMICFSHGDHVGHMGKGFEEKWICNTKDKRWRGILTRLSLGEGFEVTVVYCKVGSIVTAVAKGRY